MERYCDFCKKLYSHTKDIHSHPEFVVRMFNSANMGFFKNAELNDEYAKLLYTGKSGATPKPITASIRSTAPANFDVHAIRLFFYEHIKNTDIITILNKFSIPSSLKADFNALTYALAEEFILYCKHDENDEYETVAQLYEKFLINPVFIDDEEIRKKHSTYEKLLLTQIGSICPYCNKNSLFTQKGTNITINYSMIPIFPTSTTTYEKNEMEKVMTEPTDKYGFNNVLVLCYPCAISYQESSGNEKINTFIKLKQIKDNIKKKQGEIKLLNSLELNQNLAKIVSKLKEKKINIINNLKINNITGNVVTFDDGSTMTLNDTVVFNPSTIQDKIKDDLDLIDITKTYVLTKYEHIKAQLLLLDDEEIGFFDELKDQIHSAYQIIQLNSENKSEIVSKLSNWILTQLFGPIDANKYVMEGNIIVSFFIQNCEVFEA